METMSYSFYLRLVGGKLRSAPLRSDSQGCSWTFGIGGAAATTPWLSLDFVRGRLRYARLLAFPNLRGEAGPSWPERPVPYQS